MAGDKIIPSEPFTFLRRLHKLKFNVNHRGKIGEPKIYTIKRIMFDTKYGLEGATSKTVTFEKELEDGSKQNISVFEHYRQRWNIRLEFPNLPLVESARGGFFPMELCNIINHQRYTFKLNPHQVCSQHLPP